MERRILVVDDDEGVRLTIQHLLLKIGCEVRLAGNVAEALESFRAFAPTLVITDLIMPGQEGTVLIASLKQRAPLTWVVAMSGGARMGNVRILERAREAGADRVLSKPFAFEELVALVEELTASDAHAPTQRPERLSPHCSRSG